MATSVEERGKMLDRGKIPVHPYQGLHYSKDLGKLKVFSPHQINMLLIFPSTICSKPARYFPPQDFSITLTVA